MTTHGPNDLSDVIGPSILAQFIAGSEQFGKDIELTGKKVKIVELCHVTTTNESWGLFREGSEELDGPKHSVYSLANS